MISSSSAPQPPMELLATGPSGIVNIIRNDNQSTVEEAGFSNVFTTDNRNYAVYFMERSKILVTFLRNPQHTTVSDGSLHQYNVLCVCVIVNS